MPIDARLRTVAEPKRRRSGRPKPPECYHRGVRAADSKSDGTGAHYTS